jgi:hypothetical protein
MLGLGLGGVAGLAAAGAGGLELVARGMLPGRAYLDRIDGACSVPPPTLTFAAAGPSFSGTFYSRARRREVGYTIAYPPGHRADVDFSFGGAVTGGGSIGDMPERFYGWASVIQDGRVVATDYVPDVGWLEPSPDAKP